MTPAVPPGAAAVGRPRRLGHYAAVIVGVLLALGALGLALDAAYPLPQPVLQAQVTVQDQHGQVLRRWPAADGSWRVPTRPDEVAPVYLRTLLAYEDRWFAWHPGVNPVALARAAGQWWRHGRIVSGGSTLTMQVARLIDPALQHDTRTLTTKVRQMLRALQLEWHLSKAEILTLYLTLAPMGGPLQGVSMGSQQWLGKPPQALTLADAALLTALPRSPSRWRPDRYPERAQAARDAVLQRLVSLGHITAAEAADAAMENLLPGSLPTPWRLAPLASEHARRLQPGLSPIRTTLDAALQGLVERQVQQRQSRLPPGTSVAVLVLRNPDAAVQAYVGTLAYGQPDTAGYLDMTQAWRSPGSALKPLLYGLALDDGLIHSHSVLLDLPRSFGGYQPGNFQAGYRGPVSAAEALARSLNIPAVALLEHYGPERFHAVLQHAGLPLQLPPGASPNLSLVLGGAAVRLWDLVGAYRALGQQGLAAQPRLLPDQPLRERRLLSPGAAAIVGHMLQHGQPGVRQPDGMLWKTGTSFGFRDAWAVGVVGEHTVGVWVGKPDGTPNPGHVGASTAAPLWQDIARLLRTGARGLPLPPTVSTAVICWPGGMTEAQTPAGQCATRHTAWLLEGTAPPTLPSAGLEIVGITPGSVLRPTPGQQQVQLTLQARGGQAPYTWWWNGQRLPDVPPPGHPVLTITTPGRHTLAVADSHAVWHQVHWTLAPHLPPPGAGSP